MDCIAAAAASVVSGSVPEETGLPPISKSLEIKIIERITCCYCLKNIPGNVLYVRLV